MVDDPRRRILDAAGRCIERRGDTQIRMAEVADDAGMVRSTVYRYFPSRDELLLGLVLMRIDSALARLVQSLRHREDPRRCLPRMVLAPVTSVDGDALNEALFASESTALSAALELGSEQIVDVVIAHYQPLFAGWQASGDMYPDLDGREAARWIHTAALLLLSPAWRHRSHAAKRRFVDQFVVRALVPPIGH
ncbi:TetR/AcrR family transcriptional regulator [Mycolicibacterium sp.]|uniref:TetR/AcrR family transcriptional regulator n=1 Tax=Mycolicibacterium sp. TaxID=2320850 RepID=UPI001A35B4DA|nr:TetR/AcrR family transcriptional regulator [Mycolicibacterium sp.]MBJ7337704.1 TetR/AcrR family transcriptional regulator [Mycolicibacterium sp.]